RGVDMFDCVMPTRAGRTARAYTERGIINLRNARHAIDARPISPECDCPACVRHSRAYLHHLFRAREILGPMLLTWHNLAYYQRLMRQIRNAILHKQLATLSKKLHMQWQSGDWTENDMPQPPLHTAISLCPIP
ncbi:MAG: tRNA-guanine transglycosylase, partial [Acetobacter sp.]|nr:tRNA-guanine transglycosylase [Acetobacter sp.]